MKYTITEIVSGPREWAPKNYPTQTNLSWTVNLTDAAGKFHGDVEITQRKTTPPIQVQQQVEGHLEPSKYGMKFKREQQQRAGGGGGRRSADPGERRSIERQVAFKGAVELVSAIAPTEKPDSDTTKKLLTDFFNHGLLLIQADDAEPIKEEQAAPVQSAPATQQDTPMNQQGTGPINPMQAALDELRGLLNAWTADNATSLWENKLASMGLSHPKDADDFQIEELLTFVRGQVQ